MVRIAKKRNKNKTALTKDHVPRTPRCPRLRGFMYPRVVIGHNSVPSIAVNSDGTLLMPTWGSWSSSCSVFPPNKLWPPMSQFPSISLKRSPSYVRSIIPLSTSRGDQHSEFCVNYPLFSCTYFFTNISLCLLCLFYTFT